MDKMGSGVSQNGSSPSQPKGTSDGPRPPRDPYQQLNNVLSEYKDGKKSLSVDDVKALQEFIQHHQKDGSSQSTHGLITMKQQLSSFEKQRQDILNKISEVAGARLKSNNPAIADLSDQNRPSKLAEKFSELYDNEWTDAAEELKQTIKFPKETSEEEMDIVVIKFLYNFAKVTYEECKKKAAEQLKHVKDAVSFHNENVGEMAIELDRKCRDFIRRHCEITLSQALKILPYKVIKDQTTAEEELGIAVNQLENCKHANDFFKLCTRLCWMMALQDPPVYMVTSTDSMEMYRAYTRSGDLIEYVVWPSLLLHEDGPLLYKGVAQFKKRDGKKEKENSEVKSVVDNDKTVHAEDPIYANVDNSDNNKDSIKNGTVKTQTKTKPGDNSSGGPHVTKIDVK
ncbi:uncharacterized protein LOC133196438 [Saccostrea echinata]|uniref:uncharacterized protein LOC133196438 n=1 Tax=Saccostrea echinata TaxID=191078 RepID=UPI002A802E8B|nr:uncharacterized protein LOC133196438 [Saccostrea echinata]XP_061188317.1 uncharacterized protein LOC133196438 [Saccostrea echinata]